jgi:hypothetical protein
MFLVGLLLALFSIPVFALNSVTSTIYQIDQGIAQGEEVLILLSSGQVLKVPSQKSRILEQLSRAQLNQTHLRFTLDEDRYVISLEPITSPTELLPESFLSKQHWLHQPQQYTPTTIASMDVAKKYFREARYNPKESQCFNRAMVWSYEWWRDHSLRSQKLLIYFSRTYIRRYNFEWWFHIAPYVHVLDNGQVVERVMDVKYSRGPVEFRRWTNLFMRNDAECRVITKFSDYADYPYTGECYLQRTDMYTYQPADLQMNEAWGYTKDKFNMTEVRQAYLEAFDEVL